MLSFNGPKTNACKHQKDASHRVYWREPVWNTEFTEKTLLSLLKRACMKHRVYWRESLYETLSLLKSLYETPSLLKRPCWVYWREPVWNTEFTEETLLSLLKRVCMKHRVYWRDPAVFTEESLYETECPCFFGPHPFLFIDRKLLLSIGKVSWLSLNWELVQQVYKL